VAIAGALSLTHCAQNPVTGDKNFVLMSEQQEIQMGAQAHKDVLKEYAALDNPGLQAYVNVSPAAGEEEPPAAPAMAFHRGRQPRRQRFHPAGGYVYVTRGIMAYLNSEAELAGVVGHEIGHVTARHGVRQQSAQTAAGLGAVLGSILVPGLDNQAGPRCCRRWRRPGQRAMAASTNWSPIVWARISRQNRLQSAGDDRNHRRAENQELFAAAQAKRDGRQPRTYHGTSTPIPATMRASSRCGRGEQIHRCQSARRPQRLSAEDGRGVFWRQPDQGVIRGNALLHEKLGLAIQFPTGWRVQNRPDRVMALSPKGMHWSNCSRAEERQAAGNLAKGLKLDAGARYDSGNLSGYPAAFAAGAQQGKPVVVAAVVFNGTQYLIAGLAKDKPAYDRERSTLRAAINSFRAITPAEKQAARPYVLRLSRPSRHDDGRPRQQSPLGADARASCA